VSCVICSSLLSCEAEATGASLDAPITRIPSRRGRVAAQACGGSAAGVDAVVENGSTS
jgi:hypothetical protein